ncbi:hypothetical protein PENTCL1PPCAC_9878 [Pristionchus entomophagus]|uniref:acid phosphatase n=1 Tax=Pristionchus entomophagus TaxID=358040 RepID=A0AAV5T4D7_9BILA|nr:hypothetical protein PENTCL1PPCAC_9878 [Pristionchus entomophagus]
MIHPIVLLALLGAVIAAPSKVEDDKTKKDELQLVQVVIRHGDRAATNGFATEDSAKVLFRGLGELSDDGIDHAHKQGHHFKLRYVDKGFIDHRFIPSQVRFRASSVSRVLMSAGSFSNALFRKTKEDNSVVPPIYTKEYSEDSLLAPPLDCEDDWEDVMDAMNITSPQGMANSSLAVMEQTMWPESCKDVPAEKVDAIIAELPNVLIKMPEAYNKCAKEPAKKFMYDYIELLGGSGDHFNKNRLMRTVGMLTTELLQNMNKVACGSDTECVKTKCRGDQACMQATEKFRVYYSHDVNVLALSHVFKAIDNFHKITPAFSSALVFELWKYADGGYYVKIFLKDGQYSKFVDTGLSKDDSKLEAVNKFASEFATTEPMKCTRTPVEN